MKIKFFKKEKNFKKTKSELNFYFFWKLAIGFVFVTALLSFLFGYYLFAQINQEYVFNASGDSNNDKTISKERIDKVLEYFSEKQKKSSGILNFPAPMIDPSL